MRSRASKTEHIEIAKIILSLDKTAIYGGFCVDYILDLKPNDIDVITDNYDFIKQFKEKLNESDHQLIYKKKSIDNYDINRFYDCYNIVVKYGGNLWTDGSMLDKIVTIDLAVLSESSNDVSHYHKIRAREPDAITLIHRLGHEDFVCNYLYCTDVSLKFYSRHSKYNAEQIEQQVKDHVAILGAKALTCAKDYLYTMRKAKRLAVKGFTTTGIKIKGCPYQPVLVATFNPDELDTRFMLYVKGETSPKKAIKPFNVNYYIALAQDLCDKDLDGAWFGNDQIILSYDKEYVEEES